MVLYQNYQDRLASDADNWGNNVGSIYAGGNNNKGTESIYGKTVGPHNNGPSQPIAVSMIGGGSVYSTNHQNKVTSGSVLSHPGSNISTSGMWQFSCRIIMILLWAGENVTTSTV